MPRKAHIVKREIVADPIYASSLISKFVNCMMWGGKKSTAQQILYGSMEIIQKKTADDPIKLFVRKPIDKERIDGTSERLERSWSGRLASCEVVDNGIQPLRSRSRIRYLLQQDLADGFQSPAQHPLRIEMLDQRIEAAIL